MIMARFCYCSQILSGKTRTMRDYWRHKPKEDCAQVAAFWEPLKMTGFRCWLQQVPEGDFFIHCLEGESLQQIFKGHREQIALGDPLAVAVQELYRETLGKDYALPSSEPKIECLLDISLSSSVTQPIRRGFVYPLLPEKEEAHRRFRQESMGVKRERHKASMRAFGMSRLTSWLQECGDRKYIVVYSESIVRVPQSSSGRLELGKNNPEWREIAANLIDQSGLSYNQLSPDVEWLYES